MATDVRPDLVGRTLSHYRIVEKLAEGGMGVLYRARDSHLERDVAIKVLRPETLGDPSRRRRLVQEARAASALNHAHIVTVYDVGNASLDGHEVDFIAMECVEGRTLRQVMSERRLGVVEALDYAIQVAEALAAAHAAGIIHRDVKPANVMVSGAGQVKVLDFGLAKPSGGNGSAADATAATQSESATDTLAPHTREGVVLGTTAYMSPEQAQGETLDARSDIFSFGSVLYEMLAGRRAFQGASHASLVTAILRDPPPPLRAITKGAGRDLERVVRRCLAKDRAERYPAAGELLLDLIACRTRAAARTSGWRGALRHPGYVATAVVAGVVAASLLVAAWRRGAPVRWARDVALPEIDRLVAANEFSEAYWLARRAEPHLPHDPQLERFWKERCLPFTIQTRPPGAEVSIKSYRRPADPWKPIGRTPLADVPVPLDMLRLQIAKPGYATVYATFSTGAPSRSLSYTLDEPQAVPQGMVRVAGGAFRFRNHPPVQLDDYWLDRHEVTNQEYKDFVDRGGYENHAYWTQPFRKDGRTLTWEEAMAFFRDATGRPGPATWELGTYPEGQARRPVGGVSWFEAAAYAEFAGKSLPSFYHWFKATDVGRLFKFADILEFSNFRGHGAVDVGSLSGMSPFGTYDMAGNVREWCATESGGERYILGGAWNEPAHLYALEERLPAWSRLPVNGFRCARYRVPPAAPLAAPVEWAWRDYSREKPASDEAFRSYRSFYAYDRGDIHAKVEAVEETEQGRRERISFAAAYGEERLTAYLFLPRTASAPYQTVVFFPTGEASFYKTSDNLRLSHFDFLMRSGRAVLHPIYKGTYERRLEEGVRGLNEYRDLVVQQVKDIRRSLDYLETRSDIDASRLGLLGVSTDLEFLALALDDRLRVGVAHATGLPPFDLPAEIDTLNFAPRVRQPFLMLNGRYDSELPVATLQEPLFRMLGTPETDKRLVLVDSGHSVVRTLDRVRETVDFLDRHLGPVERR